jgi:cbb3-type cytochrome oxidase subunit 3
MNGVRVLFVAYLSLISIGLVYFALLGLLGR